MPDRSSNVWLPMLVFALAYALLATFVGNDYYLRILTIVLIWAVMGLSWNLLSGYSGLVSFGHAAFFGLGGYFVVLAQLNWQWSPWISIPVAGLVGGVAGVVIGLPTFRLRGHYFALGMLAYPLALLYVFEWLGYQEVTLPRVTDQPAAFMQFHDDGMRIYVYIALGMLLAAMMLSAWVERHRFGRSLLAIKQDETAAEASGIDTRAWKLRAITLSGAMAGAIGGFYAVVQLVVTPPSAFGMLISAQALTVAMFGGVGTLWGPVIGAVVLVPTSAWLDARFAQDLPGIQGVLYGVAIIAVVLIAPEGLFWKFRDLIHRRRPAPGRDTRHKPSEEQPESHFSVPAPVYGGAILSVEHLNKTFGGLRAVNDVSFEIDRGEIVGLIGPNGAGKTTLFNLLNGLIAPDSGDVRLDGRSIIGLGTNRICARGVGRTFQVVKPFRRMTLLENVIIGAYTHARNDSEAALTAQRALTMAGLSNQADRLAGTLSNEQLRLVELARALAGKPSLLLLDEIFAGLARDEVDSLMAKIRQLAELGITVVIIEHTMQAMVQLVDRFIVLDHGSVLAQGSPDEITSNADVISAYLGKKWADDA
ncbi:MAG: branched-chain amino acid ABC transporter ATP-binding protein/permease [Gammaproteobacteria bacterium]|jgi:branched-chain amino acid transport system permease protein